MKLSVHLSLMALLRRYWGIAATASAVYAQSYCCSTQQSPAQPTVSVSSTSPFEISVQYGQETVRNSAILVGSENTTTSPVSASSSGQIVNGTGQISASVISSQVVRISVNTTSDFVGAQFANTGNSTFYGVWYALIDSRVRSVTNLLIAFKGVPLGR